jgi:hypothetical protein
MSSLIHYETPISVLHGSTGLVGIAPGREFYQGDKGEPYLQDGMSARSFVTALALGITAFKANQLNIAMIPIVTGSEAAGFPKKAHASIARRFVIDTLVEDQSPNSHDTNTNIAELFRGSESLNSADRIVIFSDIPQGTNVARGLRRNGVPVTGVADAARIVLTSNIFEEGSPVIETVRRVQNDPKAGREAGKQALLGVIDFVDRRGLIVGVATRRSRPKLQSVTPRAPLM